MLIPLVPTVALLLAATPATTAGTGTPRLRAHILEMNGLQWRAELLDRLEFVAQGENFSVWTADAGNLRGLVAEAVEVRPADSVNGVAVRAIRTIYVASLAPASTVMNRGKAVTSFVPRVGEVLDGVQLDLKGTNTPSGILADVSIRSGRLRNFHTASRREALAGGDTIQGTIQVPNVTHETAAGRWLVPTGRALVVALGTNSQPSLPFLRADQDTRIVVIDAGDVPDAIFGRTGPTLSVRGTIWAKRLGWPAGLSGVLAVAFFAGWFVRGGVSRHARSTPAEAELEPIAQQAAPVGSGRAPRVADLLVMVMAAAAACWLVRSTYGPLELTDFEELLRADTFVPNRPILNVAVAVAVCTTLLGWPMIAAGALTLTTVALRSTARERSVLFKEPGVLASVQASLALLSVAGFGSAGALWMSDANTVFGQCAVYGPALAALAVAGCWSTMLLRGTWRPAPSWTDRLGRLLGFGWLAMFPITIYLWLEIN